MRLKGWSHLNANSVKGKIVSNLGFLGAALLNKRMEKESSRNLDYKNKNVVWHFGIGKKNYSFLDSVGVLICDFTNFFLG